MVECLREMEHDPARGRMSRWSSASARWSTTRLEGGCLDGRVPPRDGARPGSREDVSMVECLREMEHDPARGSMSRWSSASARWSTTRLEGACLDGRVPPRDGARPGSREHVSMVECLREMEHDP